MIYILDYFEIMMILIMLFLSFDVNGDDKNENDDDDVDDRDDDSYEKYSDLVGDEFDLPSACFARHWTPYKGVLFAAT